MFPKCLTDNREIFEIELFDVYGCSLASWRRANESDTLKNSVGEYFKKRHIAKCLGLGEITSTIISIKNHQRQILLIPYRDIVIGVVCMLFANIGHMLHDIQSLQIFIE